MKVIRLFTTSVALSLAVACSDGQVSGPSYWSYPGSDAAGGSSGTASVGGTAAGVAPSAAGSAGTGGSSEGGGSAASGTAGGGGVAGQGGASGQGGSAGSIATTPTDGQGLYDANCKLCHGGQGQGSLLAPEIQHPVFNYATWVVRNGRAQTAFPKAMDKVGPDKLSDAQLMLIFDYLALPPQPTTGKALYDDYCANCHGADAMGGPTQRNITSEVSKVQELVRSGKNIGQFQMRHDSMPAFSTSIISDSELVLIRDYVDSL